jgi:flagellar biogenesis protein FliO
VPPQELNIIPSDKAAPRTRRFSAQAEVLQQLLHDILKGIGPVLSQIAAHAVRLMGQLKGKLAQVKVRRATKRLTVQETVSLGEKRFVAIVQVDGQQFLLGGAPNSVAMLAQLTGDQVVPEQALPTFSQALKRQCEADRNLA